MASAALTLLAAALVLLACTSGPPPTKAARVIARRQVAPASGSAGARTCVDDTLCVTMAPANNGASVDVTIATTAAGWTGVGIGEGMTSADCLIVWRQAGQWTVSRRYASGYRAPAVAAAQNVQIVSSNATSVTVRRPASLSATAQDHSFTDSSQSFIYAYSDTPVTGAALGMHDARGTFSYNALAAAAKAPPKVHSPNEDADEGDEIPETPASVAGTSGAPPVLCVAPKLCVAMAAVPGTGGQFVDVRLTTTVTDGWVAVGIGASMASADCLMAWRETGRWVVSRRYSTGRTTPRVAPTQSVRIVASTTDSVTIRRPAALSADAQHDRSFQDTAQTLIWAVADGRATSASSLGKHQDAGVFTYNALAADGSAAGAAVVGVGANRAAMLIAHGVLMAVAWSVVSFMGIYAARFLKNIRPKAWFPIHRALLTLVVVLTLIAFAIAVAATDGAHFSSIHGALGLAVVALSVMQALLGVAIDKWFNPTRTRAPWHDKLHWMLGYVVAVLAPANVFLGHFAIESATWVLAVNGAVVGAAVGVFIWAQVKIGQQHEHDAPHLHMPPVRSPAEVVAAAAAPVAKNDVPERPAAPAVPSPALARRRS
ncbi:DOMON domain-containing protein frrs1L [Allomyces javanicus]|nr:DOMON domain-containing protein frrs1L [Allomyces javanicus]